MLWTHARTDNLKTVYPPMCLFLSGPLRQVLLSHNSKRFMHPGWELNLGCTTISIINSLHAGYFFHAFVVIC